MPNPMCNPQPNYSGVTIQITNPTVNAGAFVPPPNVKYANQNSNYATNPQIYCSPQCHCAEAISYGIDENKAVLSENEKKSVSEIDKLPQSYPAGYYINNYNYQDNGVNDPSKYNQKNVSDSGVERYYDSINENPDNAAVVGQNEYSEKTADFLKHYDDGKSIKDTDMTRSNVIKEDLDSREEELKAQKENTKETKIVALTDEYIKSLENYLNNPNNEIRLMASKEILTRLDEDKDRYDDAALNALLNKMLQDPYKLIRVAALSAFASQLASGNDYTIELLHNIQSNPSADKEDVLQAADILLKMSAGTEVKNIPTPVENKTTEK